MRTCSILKVLIVVVIVVLLIVLNKHEIIRIYYDAKFHLNYKSLLSNEMNYNNSLTWISTKDGISSHFFQLQTMYSLSKYYNLTLRLVDYQSNHYGKNEVVRMCDIFTFPSGIICMHTPIDMIIRSLVCTIPIEHYDNAQKNPAEELQKFLHTYNIKKGDALYLDIKNKFSWSNISSGNDYNSKCSLATSFVFQLKTPTNDNDFPIIMTEKYVDMFNMVKTNMFEDNRHNYIFIAVHWRRGDQLQSRCKNSSDSSVNCEHVSALVLSIKNAIELKQQETNIFGGKDILIYVATNEEYKADLILLSAEGYFLKSDVLYDSNDQYIENKVDIFIMEFLLMSESDLFLYWGESGVHDLVLRYKKQTSNYNRHLIVKLS